MAVRWAFIVLLATQLELSASNTVKVDYRLPVTCSDFNSTTVNSLGLDFIDLLPVTLSISYRCLNVVSNTDLYAICSHYYHDRCCTFLTE